MSEADETTAHATGGVGARLRTVREEQGLSLEDIGRQTRVPVRHLVQIEEGRLEGLPAAPYSAGFVKAYARAVGLDATVMSHEFRAEFDRAQAGVHRIAYEPYEPADPSRLPPKLLAIVALVIAVLLIGSYAIWRSGVLTGEGPDTRAQLAANGDPNVTTPAPVAGAPAAAPVAAPVPAGGAVVLTAVSPTWFKVSERNGATLFTGTLDQGKTFPVPPTAVDPVIRTGKPEGLSVTVGGRPVAPLGEPAHMIANVSLKADALTAKPIPAGAAPIAPPTTAPATVDPSAPAAFRGTGG